MDKINYKNHPQGDFPVSVETFDRIQQQIEFLQQLGCAWGNSYLVVAPTSSTDGVVMLDGELLPLRRNTSGPYVIIAELAESIEANGNTYSRAIVKRVAVRIASATTQRSWNYGDLQKQNPQRLAVAEMQNWVSDAIKNALPQGLIVMWSGTTVPYGWTLCDGQNGTPDLRDRFIVGAGRNYNIGATGGEDKHKLLANEMPVHAHSYTQKVEANDNWKSGGTTSPNNATTWHNQQGGTYYTGEAGGNFAHENRPPYYALAYIMRKTT